MHDYIPWDGTSYCVERCGLPATVRRLTGMVDATPLYELVCADHVEDTQ